MPEKQMASHQPQPLVLIRKCNHDDMLNWDGKHRKHYTMFTTIIVVSVLMLAFSSQHEKVDWFLFVSWDSTFSCEIKLLEFNCKLWLNLEISDNC